MKSSLVGKPGKPSHLLLSHLGVTAKIYSAEKRAKNGQVYGEHTLVYKEGSLRRRSSFADLSEAKREAELVLTKIAHGQAQVLDLTNTDRENYVHSMEALEGTGVPLLAAVHEYRAAHDLLGGKATLNEAVRFFMSAGAPDIVVKPVKDVVDEMLKAKEADGTTKVYRTDLELRLNRFVKSFPRPIGDISTKEIEDWLRGLNTGPRNRNNFASVITSMFRFAKRAGYLPRDRVTAADLLTRAKIRQGANEGHRCHTNRLPRVFSGR